MEAIIITVIKYATSQNRRTAKFGAKTLSIFELWSQIWSEKGSITSLSGLVSKNNASLCFNTLVFVFFKDPFPLQTDWQTKVASFLLNFTNSNDRTELTKFFSGLALGRFCKTSSALFRPKSIDLSILWRRLSFRLGIFNRYFQKRNPTFFRPRVSIRITL